MADVKFTIQYEINTDAPIPAPRAVVTMKVKADEAGRIPANVRCMDRMLGEPMNWVWGDKREDGDLTFRVKQMGIESESWPAIQARVEEIILGALAKMQEADARYQKMVAEQPADYIYETSIPGPALQDVVNPATPPIDEEEEREEKLLADVDNRPWVMSEFGLSALPCESATNFLVKHFDDISRYAKRRYGGQAAERIVWWNLTPAQRFDAGIAWMGAFLDADDETAYPLADWIEWAQNHRA